MTVTKTEIYNLCLINIGHTRKATADSTELANCESIYEQKKRSLLTMADWSFARTYTTLALTGNTATGWTYEYAYPNGCLKAIEIARESSDTKPIPFTTGLRYNESTETEQRVILTDEANAELVYIRDIQSTTLFTPKFVDALWSYMNITLARLMAKKESTVQEMTKLFEFHMSEAIRSGETEAADKPELDAIWIRDR